MSVVALQGIVEGPNNRTYVELKYLGMPHVQRYSTANNRTYVELKCSNLGLLLIYARG